MGCWSKASTTVFTVMRNRMNMENALCVTIRCTLLRNLCCTYAAHPQPKANSEKTDANNTSLHGTYLYMRVRARSSSFRRSSTCFWNTDGVPTPCP